MAQSFAIVLVLIMDYDRMNICRDLGKKMYSISAPMLGMIHIRLSSTASVPKFVPDKSTGILQEFYWYYGRTLAHE